MRCSSPIRCSSPMRYSSRMRCYRRRTRCVGGISGAALARLALALLLLPARPLLAQSGLAQSQPSQTQGMVLVGSNTGPPGSTVSVPLTVALNPGTGIDTLGVTVVITPVGSAPPLTTGKLSFTSAAGAPAPSISTADPGDIVLAWLGNLLSSAPQHPITGTVLLGVIAATIPAGAQNAQAYSVQITKEEGDVTAANGSLTAVPLASVSSAIGPVSTSVPPPPVIEPNGILNAASYATDATVSPGSIASLFGLNLATTTTLGTSTPPLTMLAGTELLIDGIPAPLFYVSPSQINFQAPVGISGTSAEAVVTFNGASSLAISMNVAPLTPGIFSSGTGQGAVLNQDFSINSAQNPAPAGSAIMIYATGLGPTNPPFVTGQAGGTSPPNLTTSTPVVLINGASAQVLYSGLAPGFAGEYQVNALIPAGTRSGAAIPLLIQIGGQTRNPVPIAVQ
jgi:uncharacterized protein (TIGR03437 family)